jgi:hypothetical protein
MRHSVTTRHGARTNGGGAAKVDECPGVQSGHAQDVAGFEVAVHPARLVHLGHLARHDRQRLQCNAPPSASVMQCTTVSACNATHHRQRLQCNAPLSVPAMQITAVSACSMPRSTVTFGSFDAAGALPGVRFRSRPGVSTSAHAERVAAASRSARGSRTSASAATRTPCTRRVFMRCHTDAASARIVRTRTGTMRASCSFTL